MFDTQNTVDVSIISVGDCQGGQSGPTPQVCPKIAISFSYFERNSFSHFLVEYKDSKGKLKSVLPHFLAFYPFNFYLLTLTKPITLTLESCLHK